MTRYSPQWIQDNTYPASVDRYLLGAIWPYAASQGCAVTAASAMTLNVAPGQIAVPTLNSTGSSLCTSDAVEQVTLDPAPPSGQNRIDLVICRPRAADIDGSPNDDFIFDHVAGTAGTSASIPATPAGTVALAQVAVGGGVASITNANITDVRPFQLAIGSVNGLPAPLTSGTAIKSYTDDNNDVWVAKAGVFGGAYKKARDVLHSRWYRNGAWSWPTAATVLTYDTVSYDPYSLYASARFTAPIGGLYYLRALAGYSASASGQWAATYPQLNGVTMLASSQGWSTGVGGILIPAADLLKLNGGDYIQIQVRASNALAGLTSQQYTSLTVQYLGTG
jgi:hypothetical protein